LNLWIKSRVWRNISALLSECTSDSVIGDRSDDEKLWNIMYEIRWMWMLIQWWYDADIFRRVSISVVMVGSGSICFDW